MRLSWERTTLTDTAVSDLLKTYKASLGARNLTNGGLPVPRAQAEVAAIFTIAGKEKCFRGRFCFISEK